MQSTRQRRARALQLAKNWIAQRGRARLEMSAIVALSGACAFAASALLRWQGMTAMALRYPLAVACGYLTFLGLLGLWLKRHHSDDEEPADTFADAVDLLDTSMSELADLRPASADEPARFVGGGGDFGGGGASGTWVAQERIASAPVVDAAESGAVLDGLPDTDADDWMVVLVIVVSAAVAVFSSLYVVYSAPELLAELLADAMVSATVYGRLQRRDERNWLSIAVRRSAVPALLTALAFTVIGWAAGVVAPDADTLGQAIAAWRAS